MKKLILIAALVAPFVVTSMARAEDDGATKTTKKSKKMKKTKTEADGTQTTTEKSDSTKTEKPAGADAPPPAANP